MRHFHGTGRLNDYLYTFSMRHSSGSLVCGLQIHVATLVLRPIKYIKSLILPTIYQ